MTIIFNSRFISFITLLIFLQGCHHKPSAPVSIIKLHPTIFYALPDWQQDHKIYEGFLAFRKSCGAIVKMNKTKELGLGTLVKDWIPGCQKALKINPKNPKEVRHFFESCYMPYRVSNNGEYEGLITGYYESQLQGSRTPTARFKYPLYKKPSDLHCGANSVPKCGRKSFTGSLHPHHNRKEIHHGALYGKGLELVWVDDPVEAFFLHIQGSGRVTLPDGSVMRIGYAATNGHPYVSIGKELANRAALDIKLVSMQAIRKWMADNPHKSFDIMHLNPSYIFFTELFGDGPLGCMGVAVTPQRSLAIDRKFIPLGAPLWLDAAHPDNDINVRNLVIAQDTGGAIKGPVRGDYFWGYGKKAFENAGKMKSKGQYYIFLPKDFRLSLQYLETCE